MTVATSSPTHQPLYPLFGGNPDSMAMLTYHTVGRVSNCDQKQLVKNRTPQIEILRGRVIVIGGVIELVIGPRLLDIVIEYRFHKLV